ncbi:hypothetical protein EVAR_101321_1 [Eumeta japonica]|uniref:DUF5641 domain-containing protein n=1 Tax=Eumeta variegata TaxID=151549 RepID=A0A4C1SXF9_EUMVA|nr:hypothetical protein EVAR_101321_1 [Eumeta japonica]
MGKIEGNAPPIFCPLERGVPKSSSQRYKWRTPKPDIQPGDLVVVKDDLLPPQDWRLGRVENTFPGPDGKMGKIEGNAPPIFCPLERGVPKSSSQRYKWRTPKPDIQPGDLVVVKDDLLPPQDWRLGRVEILSH